MPDTTPNGGALEWTEVVSAARKWSHAELRARIDSLGPWFHNLDLKGVRTAPLHFLGDFPAVKWRSFAEALPQDLTGKSVLDIGCNAGFYAMQMKRRGATRVLGIDHDETYLRQARFAAEVEGLDVEFRQLSVYDVGALAETFDIVFFIGVLYHLRHPLLALDLIHEHVTRDVLVFQSMQRGSAEIAAVAQDYGFFQDSHFHEPGSPRLHFIEHDYAHDPTNWWAPNRACSAAMLRSAGYEITLHPEDEIFICRHVTCPGNVRHAVYPARSQRA